MAPHITKFEYSCLMLISPLRANPTKWSNTLKQIVGHLETPFEIIHFHFQSVLAFDLEFISVVTFDFFCLSFIIKESLYCTTIIKPMESW